MVLHDFWKVHIEIIIFTEYYRLINIWSIVYIYDIFNQCSPVVIFFYVAKASAASLMFPVLLI